MKARFFQNIETLADLKKAYHKLAIKFHPDNGGDHATMAKITAEYEMLFAALKKQHNEKANRHENGYYETTENAEDFTKIIDFLMQQEGLTIEICGNWIWVDGNTKPIKEELKAYGLRWASKKKMWYWRSDEYSCQGSKKTKTMAEIRFKYGSQMMKSQSNGIYIQA